MVKFYILYIEKLLVYKTVYCRYVLQIKVCMKEMDNNQIF